MYMTGKTRKIVNSLLIAELINLYKLSIRTSREIRLFYRHSEECLVNYL